MPDLGFAQVERATDSGTREPQRRNISRLSWISAEEQGGYDGSPDRPLDAPIFAVVGGVLRTTRPEVHQVPSGVGIPHLAL